MNEDLRDLILGRWEPPALSTYVETEFGRSMFAKVWEAYNGGVVIDVYGHRDHAYHDFRRTLDLCELLRLTRAEVSVNRPRLRIRIRGGGIVFTNAYQLLVAGGLDGLSPTLVDDAGLNLPPDVCAYLRSRGAEVVTSYGRSRP